MISSNICHHLHIYRMCMEMKNVIMDFKEGQEDQSLGENHKAANNVIEFYVHGERQSLNTSSIPSTTKLCDYLRDDMGLTGTKVMCREGGCGACLVAVTFKHPITGKKATLSVPSCLTSVYSCSTWEIKTIEGIWQTEYHDIQKSMVENNGTQCGYCSSGMVMNMVALKEKYYDNLTETIVENSFGGNLCRCTGYGSIITAFRDLVKKEEDDFEVIGDIEDIPCGKKCSTKCLQTCPMVESMQTYEFTSGNKWFKVFTLNEVLKIFKTYPTSVVRLVAGNSAQGVYRDMATEEICVDINSIAQLKIHEMNNNEVVIGGNVTLTEAIGIFKAAAISDANFKYLDKFAEHLINVASLHIRNIGTLTGNLMIKHAHNEFPSDVYLLLSAIGAKLNLVDSNGFRHSLKIENFLGSDMTKRIIESIQLKSVDSTYKYGTYKIMPRAQNAHAIVNAAFFFKFDKSIVKEATIVYGGINPNFVHASKSENYLIGQNLFDNKILQKLFIILYNEIKPDHVLPDPSPDFRKMLAVSLMYKFILSIAPEVQNQYKSGGNKLIRGLSQRKQEYIENDEKYPIGKGIHKLEAYSQVSGEAQYIMDMTNELQQQWGCFVVAKYPAGTKIEIDAETAKLTEGVLDFINYKDIKGVNSYVNYDFRDPIFCEGKVLYYKQPVGLIVAKTKLLAQKAAELVVIKVVEANRENPVINLKDALHDESRVTLIFSKSASRTGNNTKKRITGTSGVGPQYQHHMETQCCSVVPKENGEFDMYPSSQWMDFTQITASRCMNVPMNKINVIVRRLGGAFGGKTTRNCLLSCAAFVAAVKWKKPIKIALTFEENMDVIGKRNPCYTEYTAEVDDDGVFQSLKLDMYIDTGIQNANEIELERIKDIYQNSYTSDTFNIRVFIVHTDLPSQTYCRGPGTTESHATIETIVEHVAYAVNKDPMEVRKNNRNVLNPLLDKFVEQTVKWANLKDRKEEIATFNKANRWRKRGISTVPLVYPISFVGSNCVIISIYADDATVAISHGGIEMGQGINTKAVQAVAYELGIDISDIFVKPSNNLVSPNVICTATSITSEAICMALQGCCKKLKAALSSYTSKNDWKTSIKLAAADNVKLTETFLWSNDKSQSFNYIVYGVCICEVEYDVLTGNHIIRQVNLLEDTGYSLNPYVDVGQIEGAFVMGLGYWTSEQITLDYTGELKTNRTWNYKIPGMQDIPEKFFIKLPSEPNPKSPLKTKGMGEPPLLLAFSSVLALRQAITSARSDAGFSPDNLWYPIDGPCTVEQNFKNSGNDISHFKI